MAFSIAPSRDGSNGCATIDMGSGIESVGDLVQRHPRPVGIHVHGVEDVDGGPPGAHARQFVAEVLDDQVHPLLQVRIQGLEIDDIHAGLLRGSG